MSEELKPCPFCGEHKFLHSGNCGFKFNDDDNQIRLFGVRCRTCKARTGVFESLDEATKAWNRRATCTNLAQVGTDCISRQQAIDALDDIESEVADGGGFQYEKWRKYFCELPPAQPEIIHCRECKHWKQQTNYAGAPLSFGFCESDDMWRSLYGETYEVSHIDTDDDFYCGFAERRTDGEAVSE